MTQRMSIEITQAEKAALEHYRARNGLRSLNSAVRHLIEMASLPPGIAEVVRTATRKAAAE